MELEGEAAAAAYAAHGERRRRFRRQLLVGLAIVAVGAIAVAKVPGWMLEHADENRRDCWKALETDRTTDPATCRQNGWLAIPKVAPQTKRRAQAIAEGIESDIVYTWRERAIAPGATAEDRARAVRVILASAQNADEKAFDLRKIGALDEAAKLDADGGETSRHIPVETAVAIGDMARAKAAFASGPAIAERRLGALACLLGLRERGIGILAKSDAEWRARGYRVEARSRIAAQHCGATEQTFGGQDPTVVLDGVYDLSALMTRAFDPQWQTGRRSTVGRFLRGRSTIFPHTRLAGNALALVATPRLDAKQVIELVGTDDGIALAEYVAVTPWTVLAATTSSGSDLDYVPPSWLYAAAERVEAAIAEPAPKPGERDSSELREALDGAPASLRRAAVVLYANAAKYELRRGKRDGARPALAKIDAIVTAALQPPAVKAPTQTPTPKPAESTGPAYVDAWITRSLVELAVLQLAVGDAKAALATLDRWAGLAKRPDRALDLETSIVVVDRALALLALGDHAGAHAAVKAAPIDDAAVAWLVLATAILSNQLASVSFAADQNGDVGPATWLAVLKDPSQKVPRPSLYSAQIVMPAIVVVLDAVARAQKRDPEAFLDEQLWVELPSRSVARARAEVARWRKDGEIAKRWDQRADAIDALMIDDRTAALAGLAEVW